MESPEHERRHIIEYFEAQVDDENVVHAEKVASEKVFGNRHDVWDVHTDKGRWWVVSAPMNLYTQADFKSMDVVLSFHVGLMTRLMARDEPPDAQEQRGRMSRAWRQWRQAARAMADADEAEEFQAVGMRCREALVSFVNDVASDDLVPPGEALPKKGDFVHWAELIANAVALGSSAERRRSYLKSGAKETWKYVSWLTHAKNAKPSDGIVAVEATSHVLGVFSMALAERDRGGPERCPNCHSYRVTKDGWLDEEQGEWEEFKLCPACGWQGEPERHRLESPTDRGLPTGDCVHTADISTTMTLDDYRRKLGG